MISWHQACRNYPTWFTERQSLINGSRIDVYCWYNCFKSFLLFYRPVSISFLFYFSNFYTFNYYYLSLHINATCFCGSTVQDKERWATSKRLRCSHKANVLYGVSNVTWLILWTEMQNTRIRPPWESVYREFLLSVIGHRGDEKLD